jgi:hypothetical protein
MSESSLQNPEWPNGLQKDDEGYTVFYPLGTNKVDITTITWPDGDKLVSPFVYKNGKLAGFVDTKAMTVSGSATTTMNYSHIEANFAAISEGKLTVNAPNATIKKFTWSVNTGNSNEYVIIDFNTTDEATINAVRTAKRVVDNKLYDADDSLIGAWDTSKIEVGGNLENSDGLFCNIEADGETERGLILSEFDSDLSSLRDGSNMFCGCFNLESFSSDLPSLTNGYGMFCYCNKLETFSSDLSSLTDGEIMFGMCGLTSFTSDLPSLTNGYGMFFNCPALTSFSSDLSKLTSGISMFFDCPALTSFSSDLSNLTDGEMMFVGCSSLTSFTPALPNLTNGYFMFSGCSSLTSFSSDLSKLTSGRQMFYGCSSLTSFSSDLSSLTDGLVMFDSCKLDASSVKNIIDTINTYSAVLTLGMGCDDTETDKDLFAQEVGYPIMAFLLVALADKGWSVDAQYNGRPTTTYSLRRPSEDTLPIYVKLEEVEESSDKLKSFYTHTSEDDSKKYRLDWFHETTGSTEGYTQFNSLEEAIEYFNIKPIERN